MDFFSTKNQNLKVSFKEALFTGMPIDNGLYMPSNLPDLSNFFADNSLSFEEISYEISSRFIDNELSNSDILDIAHSAISFKAPNQHIYKNIYCLELFHGPTLAFKDIAMQVIGNLYGHLKTAKDKPLNILVATSGDTGSAAIAALNNRENINLFVLHPHNKISSVQRKIMTTIGGSNIYNIAIEGSFDDCQKIVKELFNDDSFRLKINMSGVNSINWARIVCQIVYYFYAYFKLKKENISFSVPTGNFGDIYAGYIAKKMGLSINKLIVATNENDILKRVINTGEYKPDQVRTSFSPSMDIQVASNFERLLFNIVGEDDKRVSLLMQDLSSKGFFKLSKEEQETLKKDFCAEKINNKDTLSLINETNSKLSFILDPHTATALGAAKKVNDLSNTVILGTAHPYKFLETIKIAIGKEVEKPTQLSKIEDKKEKFVVIENSNLEIKNYILSKIQ